MTSAASALATSPAAWPPMPSATRARLPRLSAIALSCGVTQATVSSFSCRTRPGSVRMAPMICIAGKARTMATTQCVADWPGRFLSRIALRLQQFVHVRYRHGEGNMLRGAGAQRVQRDHLTGGVEHRPAARARPGIDVELIGIADRVIGLT